VRTQRLGVAPANRAAAGEDDLLGDLAGHLAEASSSRASKAGKVGGGRGIVSCIACTPSGQRLSSCGSDAYPRPIPP